MNPRNVINLSDDLCKIRGEVVVWGELFLDREVHLEVPLLTWWNPR